MVGYIVIMLLLLVCVNPPQVKAAVVINELLPKTQDSASQWIELYNTDVADVALDYWELRHTADDNKAFLLNGLTIPGKGFMVLTKAQTGIVFSAQGDTVQLIDDGGHLVDSKSYPNTLAYNTAMGLAIDGTGALGICSSPTPGAPNNCQLPTPTETPIPPPTNTSTPTHTPAPTEPAKPTATPSATIAPTTAVLGTQDNASFGFSMQPSHPPPASPAPAEQTTPVATPTPVAFLQSKTYRYLWAAGIGIGVLLAVTIIVAGRHHKKRKIVIEI